MTVILICIIVNINFIMYLLEFALPQFFVLLQLLLDTITSPFENVSSNSFSYSLVFVPLKLSPLVVLNYICVCNVNNTFPSKPIKIVIIS